MNSVTGTTKGGMMNTNEMQNFQDVWAVWAWIRAYGGTLNQTLITLNYRERSRFTESFRGDTYLHDAAEWVRAQVPFSGTRVKEVGQ